MNEIRSSLFSPIFASLTPSITQFCHLRKLILRSRGAYTTGIEPGHARQPEGALPIYRISALVNLVTPELPMASPLFKMKCSGIYLNRHPFRSIG